MFSFTIVPRKIFRQAMQRFIDTVCASVRVCICLSVCLSVHPSVCTCVLIHKDNLKQFNGCTMAQQCDNHRMPQYTQQYYKLHSQRTNNVQGVCPTLYGFYILISLSLSFLI